jgi:hypothetical protein
MPSPVRPRLGRLALVALGLLALTLAAAPEQARAALVITVQNANVTANTTGNTFDVTLTNTNLAPVTIAGFSFGLTTAPAITFTEANTSATSYIFAGNSAFGPIISTTPPPSGQTLLASDNFGTANAGVSIGVNGVVGLGRVVFNAGAVGTYSVTLDRLFTSLSAPNGDDVPVTTVVGGVITVTSAPTTVVPEPSSVAMAAIGLGCALAAGRARSRRARIA